MMSETKVYDHLLLFENGLQAESDGIIQGQRKRALTFVCVRIETDETPPPITRGSLKNVAHISL